LNVVAYRLINNTSIILPRSHCVSCKHTLNCFDLIPVFSWLFLGGKCRYCTAPISLLYPLIEVLTAVLAVALYHYISTDYFFSYALFFSALIVSIRTDLEYMLISRLASLCLIPVGIGLSTIGLLPISVMQSVTGAAFGYTLLWCTAKIFAVLTKKEGIGEGDFDLLAMIGSFTGILGAWMSLTIGSISGSLLGIAYILITKKGSNAKIPFGPFLALGAIIYVLYNQMIVTFLMNQ